MRIVRWILLGPAAIGAGVVVAVLVSALVGSGSESWGSKPAGWLAGVSMAAASAATLLVARAMAPSAKPRVMLAFAVLLIGLNALEVRSILMESASGTIAAKERVRIAEVIGFLAVSLTACAVATREIVKARKVPPNSPLQPTATAPPSS